MNNPAMTIKGEQAKKQLIAAALAQFGEYGMNATTREIAAQAGQNIAAITYYFWFERRFVPRLRPVDCRFYWRAVPSACRGSRTLVRATTA